MQQPIPEETNVLTKPAANARRLRVAVVGIGW